MIDAKNSTLKTENLNAGIYYIYFYNKTTNKIITKK